MQNNKSVRCHRCGTINSSDYRFCRECGFQFPVNMLAKNPSRKKALAIICSTLLIISGFVGYIAFRASRLDPISWTDIMRSELLSGDTTIEKAQTQVVTLNVKEKSKSILAVTIKAPDIYDGLMNWLNTVSEDDFSDDNFQAEILKLLSETEPSEKTVELSYNNSEAGANIMYTQEFADIISCGMVRFYSDCMINAISELGREQ